MEDHLRPMGGDDDQRGFAINMEHINPELGLPQIMELIESMKNILERIESKVMHDLLMDHDGSDEVERYFAEFEDSLDQEEKEEFWTANKLNAVFAVRDSAAYICKRFLECAGADGNDLDHGLPN